MAISPPTRKESESFAGERIQVGRPNLVRLVDVEARAVDWLWKPFLPARMLSMLSGDPGAGKSFIALGIAAELSKGRLLDHRIVKPETTLYLSVENPIAETIRPRFDALGGDPSRLILLQGVHTLDEGGQAMLRAVTLGDVDSLGAAIREAGARLVIVDPIQSYLGANVDLHRSNETRPIMDGLARLAEEHRCAILLLRHLSKQGGGKAIHRGLGSIDLTGAVRSELLAGSLPDDTDTRALVHIKSNVGQMGRTLAYSIDGDGRFSWSGESSLTAADLLASPSGPADRKLTDATRWLTEHLKVGGREQKEVRGMAEQAGISYATLRRAKASLRVRPYKDGMSGPWKWALPEDAHDDAHTENVNAFGDLSTFEDAQALTKVLNLNSLDSEGAQRAVCEQVTKSTSTFDVESRMEGVVSPSSLVLENQKPETADEGNGTGSSGASDDSGRNAHHHSQQRSSPEASSATDIGQGGAPSGVEPRALSVLPPREGDICI